MIERHNFWHHVFECDYEEEKKYLERHIKELEIRLKELNDLHNIPIKKALELLDKE